MKKYKVFTILNALSEEEMSRFEEFLKSSYFNKRKRLVDLFLILKRTKKKISLEDFNKEKIYMQLYGKDSKFNSNTFNDLLAQLFHIGEKFLFIENVQKEEFEQDLLLLKLYSKITPYAELFEKKWQRLNEIFEKSSEVDEDLFLNLFRVNTYAANYIVVHKSINRKKDLDALAEVITNTAVYLINFLVIILSVCFVNGRMSGTIFKSDLKFNLEKIISNLITDDFISLLKPVNKFYYILELYKKMMNMFLYMDDSLLYYKYKSAVYKKRKKLETAEIFTHYSKLISYCSLKLAKDPFDSKIRTELTALAKMIIKNKYYLNGLHQYLSVSLYNIFLSNAVFLKDKKSILFYLDNCVNDIEEKIKNDYKYLTLVNFNMLNEDYEKALNYLQYIQPRSQSLRYIVKTLYIRLHYHLDNTEQVLNNTDNYIKYLSSITDAPRQRISRELNFTRYIKKIVLNKNKRKFDEIIFLKKSISESEVSYKDWLLEITDKILKENV